MRFWWGWIAGFVLTLCGHEALAQPPQPAPTPEQPAPSPQDQDEDDSETEEEADDSEPQTDAHASGDPHRSDPEVLSKLVQLEEHLAAIEADLARLSEDEAQDDNDFLELDLETLLSLRVNDFDVLGLHDHDEGDYMFAYHLMFTHMSDLLSGTDRRQIDEALQDYSVSPTSMHVWKHIFSAMYTPTDGITLSAMVPYVTKEMWMRTRAGVDFRTTSEGLGDIFVNSTFRLLETPDERHSLLVGFGLYLPTGTVYARVNTPAGPQQLAPFPMQLGSGTYDLAPHFFYSLREGRWVGEAEARAIIPLGNNSRDFRFGNIYTVAVRAGFAPLDWLGAQVGLDLMTKDNISLATIPDPIPAPTHDPNSQGFRRLGLTGRITLGPVFGARLAAEAGIPIFQSVDGTQLENEWFLRGALMWNN